MSVNMDMDEKIEWLRERIDKLTEELEAVKLTCSRLVLKKLPLGYKSEDGNLFFEIEGRWCKWISGTTWEEVGNEKA